MARQIHGQVMADQGVYMPLMYMPVYYASKEMALSGQMLWDTAKKGLERCKENLITDIQRLDLQDFQTESR